MSTAALYTDLSQYYDLMCQDIDYQMQSFGVSRLHQIFGNGGNLHLDLACGTGPHIEHFLRQGYVCSGLDLNQPMLDLAQTRCPDAIFSLQNICSFQVVQPQDLITCFLYSLHYSGTLANLRACIDRVYHALNDGGVFCFNAVDKTQIDNSLQVSHVTQHQGSEFCFKSGWFYAGDGEQQQLQLQMSKTTDGQQQCWQDTHPMVAVSFAELHDLLAPYFEVHFLNHDYESIAPLASDAGNALIVCIKHAHKAN